MFPSCVEYSAVARSLHESHTGLSPIVMLFCILFMVMFLVKLKHHRYNIVRIITPFTHLLNAS
jgi:hypothetical protein